MLQILPPSAWVEFRSAPNFTSLNEGALHFAIVRGTDGKERKCVVKIIDLLVRPGLLCEGLGWLLAREAGVNVPSFAAVLRVPLIELGKCMALPPFVAGHAEYLAWCVELVDGQAVSHVHQWLFWLARRRVLSAKNTPVIAAFDVWTDNRDRNYGNVIRAKDGQYVAIDHESLLHELLWMKRYGMQFKLNSLLEEAQSRLAPNPLHRFKCDMALAARRHDGAINNVKASGAKFVHEMLPDAAFATLLWGEIEDFLVVRARIDWMSGELGVIV